VSGWVSGLSLLWFVVSHYSGLGLGRGERVKPTASQHIYTIHHYLTNVKFSGYFFV
jgi:hypothetical protein